MRSYELMVIYRYDMAEDDVRAAVAEVERVITDRSGVVTDTDFWGKRRFAYEIDHMTEGFYSVLKFDGDVELQTTLDHSLGLLVRPRVLAENAINCRVQGDRLRPELLSAGQNFTEGIGNRNHDPSKDAARPQKASQRCKRLL